MQTENDVECDAADALMKRCQFLRRLRELEREDEALRNSDSDSGNASDCSENDDLTLVYNSYLEHQGYYDDYKHVNYRFIDFGTVGSHDLVIEQDRKVGKGGFVWDAGFILADHLTNHMEWQADKCSLIELGAGTGMTGLYLASQNPNCHVHLTDMEQLQPLLQTNAKQLSNSSVGVLEWGTTPCTCKYDVIIGADVVASIYDSFGLAKTIYDLAHSDSRVYLSCRDRLAGSIERFENYLSQMFARVERHRAVSSNKNPDVYILYASGKLSDQ